MLAIGSCLAMAPLAAVAQANSLTWSVTPYLWASDTTVDLTFRDTNLGEGTLSFGDLLDVLDAAFMVHVEGGRGKFSGFIDITYLSISDTTERTLATVDTDSEQVFLDAALAWWPAGLATGLSVFGGIRYTSLEDRYRFRAGGELVGEVTSGEDYTDALLGIRYRFDLAERWSLLTHGDFSFGASEGTFLLRADIGYTVGSRRRNRILLGYQYKQAEFRDGDLRTDFTYSGPMAGFNFRF